MTYSLSKAGSFTFKRPYTKDFQITTNNWGFTLRLVFPGGGGLGIASVQMINNNPPNAQLNWPAGIALPLILNDKGPTGAMAPGFPIVQPWFAGNPGGLQSPFTNIFVQANDYIINCNPNFNINYNNVQYTRLIITCQMQSSMTVST